MTYKDYIPYNRKKVWLNEDYVPLSLKNDEDNEEDKDIDTDNDIKIRLF